MGSFFFLKKGMEKEAKIRSFHCRNCQGVRPGQLSSLPKVKFSVDFAHTTYDGHPSTFVSTRSITVASCRGCGEKVVVFEWLDEDDMVGYPEDGEPFVPTPNLEEYAWMGFRSLEGSFLPTSPPIVASAVTLADIIDQAPPAPRTIVGEAESNTLFEAQNFVSSLPAQFSRLVRLDTKSAFWEEEKLRLVLDWVKDLDFAITNRRLRFAMICMGALIEHGLVKESVQPPPTQDNPKPQSYSRPKFPHPKAEHRNWASLTKWRNAGAHSVEVLSDEGILSSVKSLTFLFKSIEEEWGRSVPSPPAFEPLKKKQTLQNNQGK